MKSQKRVAAVAGLALAAIPVTRAPAQDGQNPLDKVRLSQRLSAEVPLDLPFVDESGEAIELGDCFGDRPVILVPVFYRCPMLCTQVLNALIRTVQGIDFQAGSEYEIAVFTIDPREEPTLAAQKKLHYLRRGVAPDSRKGWHFLTSAADSIDKLTAAIGYQYAYDAETDQFAHPAAIVVLTPDGTISRYFVGLDYEATDLRIALLEASQGRIGSIVDKVLLRCFAYDPETGKYGLAIMTAIRIGGVLTLSLLASFMLWSWRRSVAAGRTRVETGA